MCPFAPGFAVLPPGAVALEGASRLLARAAETVPGWIPLTTVLLATASEEALTSLVQGGRYDALVAPVALLSRHPRLRRALAAAGMRTVPVSDGIAAAGDDARGWRRSSVAKQGAVASG
jgi:hypothetical protein